MSANINSNNPIIAVIAIQLNENETADLTIRLYDSPKTLSNIFCEEKGLPKQISVMLEENIRADKEIALKELYGNFRESPNVQNIFQQNERTDRSGISSQDLEDKRKSNGRRIIEDDYQMEQNRDKAQQKQLEQLQSQSQNLNNLFDQSLCNNSSCQLLKITEEIAESGHTDMSLKSKTLFTQMSEKDLSTASKSSLQKNRGDYITFQEIKDKTQTQPNQIIIEFLNEKLKKLKPDNKLVERNPNKLKKNQENKQLENSLQRKVNSSSTQKKQKEKGDPLDQLSYQDKSQIENKQSWLKDLTEFGWYSELTKSQSSIKQQSRYQQENKCSSVPQTQILNSTSFLLNSASKSLRKSQRSMSLNKSVGESQELSMLKNLPFAPAVNHLSTQIVASKNKDSLPIQAHARLYMQAQNKKIKQDVQIKPTKEQIVAAVQATQRLYNNRHDLEYKKQEAREKSQQERRMKEEQECTHKPRLNSTSNLLATLKKKEEGDSSRIEDKLLKKYQESMAKLNQSKLENAQSQLKGCTFRPQINEVSCVLNEVRSISSGQQEQQSKQEHCAYLFQLAKDKQNTSSKQQINQQVFEFHSQMSSSLFQERQQINSAAKQLRQSQNVREATMKSIRDENTGQEYFKPVINRGPLTERRTGEQSVNDYLYQLSMNELKKKDLLKQQEDMKIKLMSQPFINQQSKQIAKRVEEDKIKYIFNLLDSDQDGLISAESIQIDSISPELLEAISPVLYEMEEFNFTLSQEEFKDAIFSLLKTAPLASRTTIFSSTRKKRSDSLA